MPLEPRLLIERLSRDIDGVLRNDLRGLYVHGSWVLGDFDPRRSDLDLLAVLAADPTASTVEALRTLHERLAADRPEWADRVEVEYVSGTALTTFRTDPRPMVRLSPGEPLHLVPATRHYLLNWYAARERGIVLRGPRPQNLIPEFSVAEWADVVREHVRQWPDWLSEMCTPGGQAYAVLTLCRALFSIEENGQLSKRAAASWAAAALPDRTGLIHWAERWWYEAGTDAEPGRLPEVTRFVEDVAGRIAAAPAPGPSG